MNEVMTTLKMNGTSHKHVIIAIKNRGNYETTLTKRRKT